MNAVTLRSHSASYNSTYSLVPRPQPRLRSGNETKLEEDRSGDETNLEIHGICSQIITCCGRTKLKGKIVHFIKAKKLWVSARDGCM